MPAIGNFLTDLVIDAAGYKLGKRADERNLAGDCKAGGCAYHVGLGNAALDETLREFRCKGVHLK